MQSVPRAQYIICVCMSFTLTVRIRTMSVNLSENQHNYLVLVDRGHGKISPDLNYRTRGTRGLELNTKS